MAADTRLISALQPQRIWDRCDALGRLSELEGGLTRVFLSAEQRQVNELVLGWMREAGMDAQLDAIGNCVGCYEGERPGLPFAIEVVGFGDEEGVRFGSTLLGSRAVAGTFDSALLDKVDTNGVAMRDALHDFGLDPA